MSRGFEKSARRGAIAAQLVLACACGGGTDRDPGPDAGGAPDVSAGGDARDESADGASPADSGNAVDSVTSGDGAADGMEPKDVFPNDILPSDAPMADAPSSDAPDTPPPPARGWAPLPAPGAGLSPPLAWFAEAPSDPNIILAGGQLNPKHYHYRSTDGGLTWKTLHQPSGLKPADFAPTDANIVYALQADLDVLNGAFRVARSTDGGITWQARSADLDTWYDRVLVDPVNSNKIYVWRNLTDTNRVLSTSTDGGLTWSSNSAPLSDDFRADDMAIAPDEPTRIYVAARGGTDETWRFLATSNGGASWETLSTGPALLSRAHRSLAIAPSDPNVFYLLGPSLAADDAGARTSAFCRSSDRGRNWTCHAAPPGARQPNDAIDGSVIGVDAKDPNVVFVSEQRSAELPLRLFRSADGGASWNETIQFGSWSDAALVSRAVAGRVLVGSEAPGTQDAGVAIKNGIARSMDSGSMFTTMTENILRFGAIGFAVGHYDDKLIFQWGDDDWEPGYLTTDRGATWRKLGPRIRPDGALGPPLQGWNLASAVGHHVYGRSVFLGSGAWTLTAEDNGSLTQVGPGADGLPINQDGGLTWPDPLYSCSIGRDVPAIRYCCTAHGLYMSMDNGQHWSTTAHTGGCAASRSNVEFSSIVYVVSGGRLLRSMTEAKVFEDVTPPGVHVPCDASECYREVSDVILDEGDQGRVFAQVLVSPTPFVPYVYEYRESRDRGTTWTELPGQFTRQRLFPDPRDPKVLYLSGAGGVRKSRDGGTTWFDVTTGLDEWSVCRLHVTRTPGIVFAETCADDRPLGATLQVPAAGIGPLYWTATGGE